MPRWTKPKGSGEGRYKEKITTPLTDEEFLEGMQKGTFVVKPQHQALVAFLHYTAVRIGEALKMTRGQFRLTPTQLVCSIGIREKKIHRVKDKKTGNIKIVKAKLLETPPLELPLDAPYIDCIVDSLMGLKPEEKVWTYCRKTGYNIVHRVFSYPHYHRLSRITWFFAQGYTIPEVRSWTGLTLSALDYYLGLVSIGKMGRSLSKPKRLGQNEES